MSVRRFSVYWIEDALCTAFVDEYALNTLRDILESVSCPFIGERDRERSRWRDLQVNGLSDRVCGW